MLWARDKLAKFRYVPRDTFDVGHDDEVHDDRGQGVDTVDRPGDQLPHDNIHDQPQNDNQLTHDKLNNQSDRDKPRDKKRS